MGVLLARGQLARVGRDGRVRAAAGGGEGDGREWSFLNTTKISIEVPLLSSHFLGIIRMGRESVEQLRVAGLRSGERMGDAKERTAGLDNKEFSAAILSTPPWPA